MNAEEGVQAEIAGLADRIEELQLQIFQAKQDGNDGEALSLREEKIALIQERTALINLKAGNFSFLSAILISFDLFIDKHLFFLAPLAG